MDATDWAQAGREVRIWLAEQLEVEEVPDEVWGHLTKLDLDIDVIVQGDEESRQELLAEAKDYGKNPRGSSAGLRSGRSNGSEHRPR